MLKKIYPVLLLMIFTITKIADAKEHNFTYLNKLNTCKLSPIVKPKDEPRHFGSSNNLLRGSGEESLYCGERILIRGRILDQNCVPVSNAKIFLWQKGCDGQYPYTSKHDNVSTFKGTGIGFSNNEGEFSFITIKPVNNQLLNVKVEHSMLGKLYTKLTLKEAKTTPEIAMSNEIDFMQDKPVYSFDIVMKGKTYKKY